MAVKTCTKCGVPQDEQNFTLDTKSGRRRSDCNDCRKVYMKGFYHKNSAYFANYRRNRSEHYKAKQVQIHARARHERYEQIALLKSKPCADCGLRFEPCCMDFDHRDPATKLLDISIMVKRFMPWRKVLEEIAKCDVVCVCCHRLRTYKGDNAYRSARYQENRRLVDDLKRAPCEDCGRTFEPCQVDFDHVGEKTGHVSQLLAKSLNELMAEVEQCDVVCANCHRIRTQSRGKGSPRAVLGPESARVRMIRNRSISEIH